MEDILYNTIGENYNSTRKADPFLLSRMLFYLQQAPGKKILDIGCGTGNYTCEIQKNGFEMTGVDPSEKMLGEARQKSAAITWINGTAEEIPLKDASTDAVLAILTIHHWKNLRQGMQEISRVLKPGGKLVMFTSTPRQMRGYWLYHYFPHLLEKSCTKMPWLQNVETACTAAGLKMAETEKYFIQDDLQDHFLYVGKNTPEIYFDANLRNGISAFAALSNAEEVEKGLKQLRQDIDSGKFEEVKNKYANEQGDYLFVVVGK